MGSDMIIYMRWDKDIVYVLSVSLVYIFKFPIFDALNVLSSFICPWNVSKTDCGYFCSKKWSVVLQRRRRRKKKYEGWNRRRRTRRRKEEIVKGFLYCVAIQIYIKKKD